MQKGYTWVCKHCGKIFVKDTKQGLGLARSNHLRKHNVNTGDTKVESGYQKEIDKIKRGVL